MTVAVPKYNELMLPTLKAVGALGGSGSISEIVTAVIEREQLSDEQQAVLHNNGPGTAIGYRIAWARTYLKYFNLLTNSARGVWALTDEGVQFLDDPSMDDAERNRRIQEKKAAVIRRAAADRAARGESEPTGLDTPNDQDETGVPDEPDPSRWKERLITMLTSAEFKPAQFERLAQRLLREANFESVTVTGRSGDQGIDGIGTYRLGLLTFPVFFQCKRYKDPVGPGDVRDFRGAMQGRGEKGLLITTSTFTAGAKAEAGRDGATPIDLIDGDRLCELLKQYELGITTKQVEEVSLVDTFFADL